MPSLLSRPCQPAPSILYAGTEGDELVKGTLALSQVRKHTLCMGMYIHTYIDVLSLIPIFLCTCIHAVTFQNTLGSHTPMLVPLLPCSLYEMGCCLGDAGVSSGQLRASAVLRGSVVTLQGCSTWAAGMGQGRQLPQTDRESWGIEDI